MTTHRALAEAFSNHRFAEIYDHFAPDLRWVSVGGGTVVGRDAVLAACDTASLELDTMTLDRLRFLTIPDSDDPLPTVAVDTLSRYTDRSGETSVVASCDIYEFAEGLIATITSYAVQVEVEGEGEG